MTDMIWQPLETAPKDGSRIMVWDGAPYFARWAERCEFAQFENGPGWQIFECEDSFYSCGLLPNEPTHWALCPKGPETTQGGASADGNQSK